jgi:hypothetical protein
MLISAAIVAVYIVLGMLYESYIHPITILSTIPSAGVGALLALLLTHTDLTIIGIIAIILLIGIVKKNAILIVDFAIEWRREGHSAEEAIYHACVQRFRPILMTTLAALLGAVPLVVSNGTGSEMRQPLGIAIVGGLLMSQLLTLFTTPVTYLALDSLGEKPRGWFIVIGALFAMCVTLVVGDMLEPPLAASQAMHLPYWLAVVFLVARYLLVLGLGWRVLRGSRAAQMELASLVVCATLSFLYGYWKDPLQCSALVAILHVAWYSALAYLIAFTDAVDRFMATRRAPPISTQT